MTTQEAIEELKKAQQQDTEDGHVRADEILCQFLTDKGFSDIVEEYEKVDKWYA